MKLNPRAASNFQVQRRSDQERRRESYSVRGKNLLDFRRTVAITNKTKVQWTAWDGVGYQE